jgi:hypothetical protein
VDNLVTLSSTFYEQLLQAQIAKAQKRLDDLTVCFALLGSAHAKVAPRMLMMPWYISVSQDNCLCLLHFLASKGSLYFCDTSLCVILTVTDVSSLPHVYSDNFI